MTRTTAYVARLCAAMLLLAGCVVSPSKTETSSIGKFRSEHAVHYDLTVPRTARELGAAIGRTDEIFDRSPGEPLWDIQFILPGGTVFKTDGFAVGVVVDQPPASGPNQVGINARAANLTELRTRLLHDATVLGLNPAEIEGFVSGLERQPLTRSRSAYNHVFRGRTFDYLSVEVDARATFEKEDIAINYLFDWDVGATASATPTPTRSAQ